jgi:hypothetical protein
MTKDMNLLITGIIKCFNVFLDCRASLAKTDEKILLPFMRSLSVIPAQAGIQKNKIPSLQAKRSNPEYIFNSFLFR